MIACLRHPQLTEDPLLDPLHAAPEPTDTADYTSAPTVTRGMSAWGTEVKAPILSDGKKSSSSKSSRSSSSQAKSRRLRHPRGARAQCAGARPAGTDARRGSRSPSACRAGAASAQGSLGGRCLSGRGVPQDFVLPHMWYNLGRSVRRATRSGRPRKFPIE